MARGGLSFAQALGVGEKQKKPRRLSACGATAFVAFNSRLLGYDYPGFIPGFLAILCQGNNFVNHCYITMVKINRRFQVFTPACFSDFPVSL